MEAFAVFGWIIGIFVNAAIASAKGRSVPSAVVVSIFFSPLASYAYLLAVPPLEEKNLSLLAKT